MQALGGDIRVIIGGEDGDDAEVSRRHYPEFRRRLTEWRDEVMADLEQARTVLRSDDGQAPDMLDRAAFEAERSTALRTKDRQTKLLARIDGAIKRIAAGEYGFCAATGEPMTLGRLRARPIATMCVEEQDRRERGERVARM